MMGLRSKLGIAAASILAGGIALFYTSNNAPHELDNHTTELQHPGWFDHYLELKGDKDGKIPNGLAARWYSSDKANILFAKKAENNLENIEEIGPFNVGGRTRSVIIDRFNSNRYLCAGVSGGIWVSEDKGASWDIVNDYAPTLSATSITQSPFDKNLFYYGTGEARGNSADLGSLGLFRSTDGAKTFEHLEHTVTTALSGIWSVAHSLTYDSTIYVGTNSGGLWRSTDAAETFERIYSTSRRIHEIEILEDGNILIAVESVGIVKIDEETLDATTLKGGDWPASGFGRISFDYVENYPNVMYAMLTNLDQMTLNGFYKTSNGGLTWSKLPGNPTTSFTFAWYCFKLSTAPADTNFLMSTSSTNPNYSTNGGQSWMPMANSHADYHDITWINDNEMLVGNDGGVHRYNKNNMATFTNLNNGLNITQFYAGHFYPENEHIIGGTQDNGTRLTINENETFSSINGGDGAFCAVHQQDDNIRYVSRQNLNMRRQEGGSSVRISTFIRNQVGGDAGVWFISPFEINMLDGDQIYVPTRFSTYRSTDGGNTWATLTGNLLGDSYAVGLSNDENPTAYIGGTASALHRVDNAKTASDGDEVALWEPGNLPENTNFLGSTIGCIEVDPNDAGTIYCGMTNVSERPRIWRIRNADTDEPIWDDIQGNLPSSLPVNWIEVDPDMSDHIIIGTDYGLYSSLNGGASWNKEERVPNVPIDQVKLRHSDRKLFIYTHGRGIWTADLKDNLVASTPKVEPIDFTIYPNPTSQFIHFTAKPSQCSIYTTQGSLVYQGTDTVIDVRELPSGTYFLEAKINGASTIKKIVVSH